MLSEWRSFRTLSRNTEESGLPRTYGLFDLLALGIGGTVGSGVFVLTGLVANQQAGPWTPLCWALSGAAALLSAASYAELSARIPSSGSSYNYVFATLGELGAYVSAFLLSLEFGVSSAAVARSWGDKLETWLGDSFDVSPDVISPGGVNIAGGFIQFVCAAVLVAGLQASKQVTNIFTVLKMLLVVFMVLAGLMAFDVSNLSVAHVEAETGGQATAIVPSGIFAGAITCTFGYVGYDEVCCLAGETKNPRRIMHLAVFGTILSCTLLYVIASFTLVAMVPYNTISQDAGFASAFQTKNMHFAYQITSVGELVTLPLTVLVSFLGQPRVMLAMARDNLAPRLFRETDSGGNLKKSIVVNGIACTLLALFVPFIYLENMVSAGILLNFNCTNSSLIVLRARDAQSSDYDAVSAEGSDGSDTHTPLHPERSSSFPGTNSIHRAPDESVPGPRASTETSLEPIGSNWVRKCLVWSATSPEGLLVLFHVTSIVVAFCVSQLVLAVEASSSSSSGRSNTRPMVASNAVLMAVGSAMLIFMACKIDALITSNNSSSNGNYHGGSRRRSSLASMTSQSEDNGFAPVPGSPTSTTSVEEGSTDGSFYDVDINSPVKRARRKTSSEGVSDSGSAARGVHDTGSDVSLEGNPGYRVSGFPYVPLAGILVNYTLLAQLPASGLQFLAGYVGICLLCYLATVNLIPQDSPEGPEGLLRENAHVLTESDSTRGS